MNKFLIFLTIAIVGGLLFLAGCSKHKTVPGTTMTPAQVSAVHEATAKMAAQAGSVTSPAQSTRMSMPATTVTKPAEVGTATLPHLAYIALLYPLNTSTTPAGAMGKAQFAIDGDNLTIRVNVVGAAPDIAHWQHLHGFADGEKAQCPTSTADVNGDGIVDLIETATASGTTMIPLNADPVAMDITDMSYPEASDDGSYMYQVTVSLDDLRSAFSKQFDGRNLDLDNLVVYVHGVPSDTKLPASVSSLPGAPAHVTLPIACGAITAVPHSAAPAPQS